MIDPWWPMAALALVQAVDGALCLRPAAFVARCLTNVGLPEPWWKALPPIKFGAAIGLATGIWWPSLALLTTACLVAYFVPAVCGHVRARDFGTDLLVNANGMLLICAGMTAFVASRL